MAKERGLNIVSKLDFCPEYREDGGTTPQVEIGRFKYFRQVARKRNAPMLIANLMFILFLLPVLAIFVVLEVFGGVENIAYKLANTQAPYLLSDIGFGVGTSAFTTLDIRLEMLNVYYIIFAAIGVAAFIMSIGYGGMTHLAAKFIMEDTFISKKDNYGNTVPRAIKEYFKGIKRTWKEMSLVGSILLVLFAGVGNLFVWFVGKNWKGTANAGYWVLIVFVGLLSIFALMFLVHFIPEIVVLNTTTKSRIKNSILLSIQFFLPTFGIVAVFSIPFIICAVVNFIYVIIIILAVLLVYGSKWTSLILCNYEQYIAEKIITPVYQQMGNRKKKQKNNK